jgi:hypothetical protein
LGKISLKNKKKTNYRQKIRKSSIKDRTRKNEILITTHENILRIVKDTSLKIGIGKTKAGRKCR